MATMQGDGNRQQQQAGQQGQQQPGQQGEAGQLARRQQAQTGLARPIRRRALSPFGISPLSMISASPFSMVRRVFDDMERMMESMMSEFEEGIPESISQQGVGLDFIPRIDVTRRDDKLVVHADLPGLSPDQVRVYPAEDGSGLVIEGERHSERERREGEMWQSERSYGRFYRLIPLPDNVDFESAEARFENGVLEVALKAPQQRGRGRQIPIQTSAGQVGAGTQSQQRPPQMSKGQTGDEQRR